MKYIKNIFIKLYYSNNVKIDKWLPLITIKAILLTKILFEREFVSFSKS